MRSLVGLALGLLSMGSSAAAPARPFAPAGETPIHLTVASGVLSGTLVMPDATGRVPVVLIIAGSGPTDRDGNSPALSGKNDMYKMLADALATSGIASVRYDKRGVGESRAAGGSAEPDVRFEMFVDDAAAWVTQLRSDARFSSVTVVGHSEGSLIGMIASARAKAAGFVSIAGVASRASDVLRHQLRPQLTSLPALWAASDAVLTSLEQGVVVDPLPPSLAAVPAMQSLFRPSVQPYLISWFKYMPSVELMKLTIPVLLIQGTTDLQVSVDEAKALKTAKPDAQLVLVAGMNHVLKAAPADPAANVATYSNPDLPIVAEVPNAIAAFVHKIPHS